MKKTILILFSFFFITSLFAQEAGFATYVLHFKDKGEVKAGSLNPSNYLTSKAVERRLKQKISFDQADIPVSDQYIKAISKTGAHILARSRWFNTVVIEANFDMINEISALPYVSEIQTIPNNGKKQSSFIKPAFKNETVNPRLPEITKNAASDLYNYGIAFNQINQLKGQYLHNMGYSGQGMLIAVIDGGFNSVDKMPCFDSLRANNQIKGTRDFAQPGNNVYATSMASHGTSVLSCMGANSSGQMIGTAPKADYWLLRSEVVATESIIEEYYWVSAAEFADSIGADLINSSLGYTTFDDIATNHTYADMDGNTTIVTKGADKAAEKGILVVNSAGNSGGGGWWYISAPADGDSVFTIGAVTAIGIRSDFSSVGPTSDERIKPTVAAQGSNTAIYYLNNQNVPTLGTGNGTSFSSPVMCGITACLWQAFPDLNNMQIIELIKASANQANEPDSLLGWGIPDFLAATSTLLIPTKEDALDAFPNPFVGTLTLVFPVSIQGEFSIQIINLQGKVVYSRQRDEGSIRSIQINDIGYLASGMYLIKVSDQSVIYSGKIIKK
ncbi:MAG: S8/S53 family peptidase [Bacteroidales bacterium]|nr:S8/S53 family peptidase [Bacteroidales bacterium]